MSEPRFKPGDMVWVADCRTNGPPRIIRFILDHQVSLEWYGYHHDDCHATYRQAADAMFTKLRAGIAREQARFAEWVESYDPSQCEE